MAERKHVVDPINDDARLITWSGIQASDTCDVVASLSEYDDRTVRVSGVFDGATLSVHGSPDGSGFSVMNDPFGVALDCTVEKMRALVEYVQSIKPVLSGGGAGTNLTVHLLAKRKRK